MKKASFLLLITLSSAQAQTTQEALQEKQLQSILVKSKRITVITPVINQALTTLLSSLSKNHIPVTVIASPSTVNNTMMGKLKGAGVKIGFVPQPPENGVIAATNVVATGGIVQGQRGIVIKSTSNYTGVQTLTALDSLNKYIQWR